MTETPVGFLQGPWHMDEDGLAIWCRNTKIGGSARIADIRGWGYLTGTGSGGLGFSPMVARDIQKANGRLFAAAPDLYALVMAYEDWAADVEKNAGSSQDNAASGPQLSLAQWQRLSSLRLSGTIVKNNVEKPSD